MKYFFYAPLLPSFSGRRFPTVEHSAPAERQVGAVTDCF